MRNSKYEITEKDKIIEFLKKNNTIRVAFTTDEAGPPYIVPLTYGFEYDHILVFYFHGAPQGRKVDLISKKRVVGFELDSIGEVKSAEQACNFSVGYESIIGTGGIFPVADAEEKQHALNRIMYQLTGKDQWDYPEKMLEMTAVFKLYVDELSMKSHEMQ